MSERAAGMVRFRGALDGAEVLSWAQGEGDCAAPAAAHDGFEIAWVRAGYARYRIGTRELDLEEGSAIVVPAQVEHRTTLGARMRAGSTWIERSLLEEIADAVGGRAPCEAEVLSAPIRIIAIGDLLQSELERGAIGSEIAARGLLEAIAVEIVRSQRTAVATSQPSVRDPRLRRVLRFIEASFAEPLTIEGMAKEAGMSRFHFSRLFRDELGTAPYQYLLQLRVQHAAQLLRGGAGVTETAIRVGLSDPSRFATLFRRRFGVSPSEYAKRTRVRSTHARNAAGAIEHDPPSQEHDPQSARAAG